jgi:uncharacterized protein YheU (UPF0270 family)
MIKIPHSQLSEDALRGVIEDFVMREGTDYGHRDFTLEEKRDRVFAALEAATAWVTYDPESGTTSIVVGDDLN